MAQYLLPFSRMMTAGFEAWKLSMQITETMIASQSVITERMGLLGRGLDGSGELPFAEFSRLVPEKAVAFSKANSGAMRAMGEKGAMPPGLSGAFMSDAMALLDWWERSLSASSAWWMPVHAQATSNAKRLAPRRRA